MIGGSSSQWDVTIIPQTFYEITPMVEVRSLGDERSLQVVDCGNSLLLIARHSYSCSFFEHLLHVVSGTVHIAGTAK